VLFSKYNLLGCDVQFRRCSGHFIGMYCFHLHGNEIPVQINAWREAEMEPRRSVTSFCPANSHIRKTVGLLFRYYMSQSFVWAVSIAYCVLAQLTLHNSSIMPMNFLQTTWHHIPKQSTLRRNLRDPKICKSKSKAIPVTGHGGL
jgi:hypothetical protein